MILITQPLFLNEEPDLKSVLLNQMTLLMVSVPILAQLPFSVSVTAVVFILSRVFLLWFGIRKLARWQLFLMLLVVIALVFVQLGTFIGLQGGMSFLLLLVTLKSFEGSTRRDWQVSALAQIFLLTGAILFEQSLWIGAWVLLCLVLIAANLAVLNELDVRSAFKQSAMGFLLTLLPMIVLFVAMPRKDSPLWGMPQNTAKQSTTGLSESMKVGSIGDLVQSNEPAFTATFEEGYRPKSKDLYWRVMIMGHIDGDEWHALKNRSDHVYPHSSGQEQEIDYQIVFEDFKGRVPALDYPTKWQRRGIMHEAGDVLRVYSRQGARGLSLKASVSDQLPHVLNRYELMFYTDLPEQTNLQTRALAKQLWQQSGGQTEAFIQLAYDYFKQQGFAYTLQPPILASTHKTDEFLFQSKQGFCEHYADAFVRLMRSAGVPARVVTGYQGGEWDEQGQFWQIRSKDAHAWTEVWIPEKKLWQRVDPTAAVSLNRIEAGLDGAFSESELGHLLKNRNWLSRFADQSQIYWERWVVNFDRERQQSLFSLLGFSRVSPLTIVLVLLLGLIPALIPIIWWYMRSRKQDFRPLEDGFLLLKNKLLGKDYVNIPALSVMEFKEELALSERLNHDLNQLLDDYIQLNYAQSHSASRVDALKWYQRAKKLAKKYALK